MNKLIPIVIALFVLEFFCIDVSGQRQKKSQQLYIMSTEVIKADMKKQYLQARLELISVLQETGFPHPFILWSSIDNHYHIWYPIEELNDINRVDKAWEAFDELHGTDVLDPVLECIETRIRKIMFADLKLSYEPEELLFSEKESNFCRLTKLYLQNGSKQEVKALAGQVTELFESNGVTSGFYFGEGTVGFEVPVLLTWSFAMDLQDYLKQEAKVRELLGDVYQGINEEIAHHVRKTETMDFRYVAGLSYNIY